MKYIHTVTRLHGKIFKGAISEKTQNRLRSMAQSHLCKVRIHAEKNKTKQTNNTIC